MLYFEFDLKLFGCLYLLLILGQHLERPCRHSVNLVYLDSSFLLILFVLDLVFSGAAMAFDWQALPPAFYHDHYKGFWIVVQLLSWLEGFDGAKQDWLGPWTCQAKHRFLDLEPIIWIGFDIQLRDSSMLKSNDCFQNWLLRYCFLFSMLGLNCFHFELNLAQWELDWPCILGQQDFGAKDKGRN